MMTWKIKLGIILGSIALISALLLIIKWQYDIIKRQEVIQNSLVEMKKLPGGITRAEDKYVSSDDINKLAKDLNLKIDPIRDDLKKLNADVKGIQVVNVISSGTKQNNISSTNTEPRVNPPIIDAKSDPFGYQKSVQVLKLEEPFPDNKKVPLGEVKFSAWREKPWDLTLKQRKYTIVNVLGQDEDGRHYVYNRFGIDVDGKQYTIDIKDAKYIEEYPKSKFNFNPRLYLSLDFGTYISHPEFELTPNLQLALFSYGKTKINPEWTFLGLGVGYEVKHDTLSVLISPANYNIGQHIPFTKNIYVGPAISFDVHGDFAILGGIRVGL